MNGDGPVRIGMITKVHGLRGELSVMPLTDDPERFRLLKKVFIEKPGQSGKPDQVSEAEIEYVSFHGGRVTIKFTGCDDTVAAGAYRGRYISIDRGQVLPLKPDSYYIFDLIGCIVYDTDGSRVGELAEVIETGSNDVYVVKPGLSPYAPRGDNDADILVPAIKSAVCEVDVANRRIVVDPAYAVGGVMQKDPYAD